MKRSITVLFLLAVSAATLLQTSLARADSLSIGVTLGNPPPPPPIVLQAPPQLAVVPGTPVYYAPSVSFNFFFYAGRHYVFHEGAWFVATSFGGPWTFIALERVPQPILAVPVVYYKIPPGHWKNKTGPPPWSGPGPGRGPKHK